MLAGGFLGTTLDLPRTVPAPLQAFIARGVLVNVHEEELPQYRESGNGPYRAAAGSLRGMRMAHGPMTFDR